MKKPLLLILVPVVAIAGLPVWRSVEQRSAEPASAATSPSAVPMPRAELVLKPAVPESPPTVLSDATEIFKKAFWRRPAEEDTILHAERHEWAEGGEVRKWRWFIVVKPSAALAKRLFEDNVFNLVQPTALRKIEGGPAWFALPSDIAAADVLQSPSAQGGLQLVFSKTDGLLYASDSGGGFHPGAAELPKPPPVSLASGRRPFKLPPGS